ncbi:DUF378 domain-containing protein [Simkania sp.]|uniref:DUF378 domain-containing protein n=1 Tax=Simkania sp. TaxID=34094 RepID=UPI003B515C72
MKKLDVLVAILLVIGGLNWGLVGLFDFNLVDFIFGGYYIDRVIYVIVGIAAVYQAVGWNAIRKRWKK